MKEWRRKHPRVSCFLPSLIQCPVLLEFSHGKNETDGWGVIHDISLGGIKIESRISLKKGQIVFVSFSVSDNFNFVNVKGIIMRVSKKGAYSIYGIKFIDLIDQQHLQDAIEEYVALFRVD